MLMLNAEQNSKMAGYVGCWLSRAIEHIGLVTALQGNLMTATRPSSTMTNDVCFWAYLKVPPLWLTTAKHHSCASDPRDQDGRGKIDANAPIAQTALSKTARKMEQWISHRCHPGPSPGTQYWRWNFRIRSGGLSLWPANVKMTAPQGVEVQAERSW